MTYFERAIETNGLRATLNIIATICVLKAQDIQDKRLAKKWASAARVVGRASISRSVLAVSPEEKVYSRQAV
jgi:hypothetical protein